GPRDGVVEQAQHRREEDREAAAATHSATQKARLAFITTGLNRRTRRRPAALRARSASSVMGTPARPRTDSRPGHPATGPLNGKALHAERLDGLPLDHG